MLKDTYIYSPRSADFTFSANLIWSGRSRWSSAKPYFRRTAGGIAVADYRI